MDWQSMAKALSGTVARGVLWAIGFMLEFMATKGITVADDTVTGLKDAATPVGAFIAGVACQLLAAWWSKKKDAKLLATPPPK